MNYYNPLFQQMQPIQMPQTLVDVHSEDEARNYPVAFGNSVVFKDVVNNSLYVKTMGYSQTDKALFDIYTKVVPSETPDKHNDIYEMLNNLNERLEVLEKPRRATKKEVVVDE